MAAVPDSFRAPTFIAVGTAVRVAGIVGVRVEVPPALALLIPLIPAMFAWHRWDRPNELRRERLAKGQCPHCGYDLTGNVSGVCPECGSAKT